MSYKSGNKVIYDGMKGQIVRVHLDPDTSKGFYVVNFWPGHQMSLLEGEFERDEEKRTDRNKTEKGKRVS